jgi:hypothetical protein
MQKILEAQELKCHGVLDLSNFLIDFAAFYGYEMDGLVYSNFVKFKGSPVGGGRVGVFVYYKYCDEFLKQVVEDVIHTGFSKSNIKSKFEFAIHREDLAALYAYLNNLWDDGLEYIKFEIKDHYLTIGDDFKVYIYSL